MGLDPGSTLIMSDESFFCVMSIVTLILMAQTTII